MKTGLLTKGFSAVVDDRDFKRVSRRKWHASKSRDRWYAATSGILGDSKSYFRMHELIMGFPKTFWVDHKDRNTLNNTRKNLRLCKPFQNGGNSIISKNNTSGFKGVSWCKPRKVWVACICINYKTVHLGAFDTKKEASKAYEKAARKRFGKFVRI